MLNQVREYYNKILNTRTAAIAALLVIKISFQLWVIRSGLKWLSADDYCRTVISYDWLQHPTIYSGVWLSLHFWINGLFIAVFKDLTLAPVIVNTLFSALTLVYFYLILEKIFNKNIAFYSTIIYAVFPFQVWLSSSAMPESIFFFFVTLAFYYLLIWYGKLTHEPEETHTVKYIILSVVSFNIANLLRYEGWLFSLTFVFLIALLSYRKFALTKQLYINTAISIASLISALWWLYLNYLDHNDAFFFITETTRIFENFDNTGLLQRVVQYPFFVFYIAPLTTALGLRKIYLTLRNRRNGFEGNFAMLKIFLLFNLVELMLMMLTGIFGSGGTNLISRYIVLNSIMLFPFAVWQLLDLRNYIAAAPVAVLILVNIIWSFYYQQAYREDTYEVAGLTKRLIQKNYFEEDDKIYFEMTEGYYDIFPLQVISNSPQKFNTDTIPAAFASTIAPKKKTSVKKRTEEQQKLSILVLRKFLEEKKIKLFIARSDLLIDKLRKLSYKSEQIGDYRIFYISENKLSRNTGNNGERNGGQANNNAKIKLPPNVISFDRKLVLKEFRIDNSNFGLNPQTVTINWGIADMSILDSLATNDEEFGRYKVKLELSPVNGDSAAYDTHIDVFSERNVEEFFETEEIKNILIIKPFALLYYSKKFKLNPFESGIYDLKLKLIDANENRELKIYRGDSLYVFTPDAESEAGTDTIQSDSKIKQTKMKKYNENYLKSPFYPLGRIVAIFPSANYNELLKKSKDLSQIIIRNGIMLPFLNRYQGDHFLNTVFTYF